MSEPRPPLPPFTPETAAIKVRLAEDGWNSRDAERVALAYTPDCRWRNRATFIEGRTEIVRFLTDKWRREQDYRLIKALWAATGSRFASPMNGTMTVATGSGPMATRTGLSTRTA
mgnify:CR=1 FL=1